MFGISNKKPVADMRVQSALEAAEVHYQLDEDGEFRVGFELESGRSQSCIIRSATYEFLGVEIREISSVGLVSQGPFDARTANLLLRQNEQLKLGAWGVISDNEDTHAAVFTAKISADLPPPELLGVIMTVLTTADEMEARLSGRDDF
jgi:hypothetical protein